MTETYDQPRGERVAVGAVTAALLLLAVAATYLSVPAVARAGQAVQGDAIDHTASSVPVYEPAVDLYVMPGREY